MIQTVLTFLDEIPLMIYTIHQIKPFLSRQLYILQSHNEKTKKQTLVDTGIISCEHILNLSPSYGSLLRTNKLKWFLITTEQSKRFLQIQKNKNFLPNSAYNVWDIRNKIRFNIQIQTLLPDKWTHQWCPTATDLAIPKVLGHLHLQKH